MKINKVFKTPLVVCFTVFQNFLNFCNIFKFIKFDRVMFVMRNSGKWVVHWRATGYARSALPAVHCLIVFKGVFGTLGMENFATGLTNHDFVMGKKKFVTSLTFIFDDRWGFDRRGAW